METKDIVLFLGVLVTLVIGILNLWFNLRTNRRNSFVNTVTSERIRWIAKFRENIALLCASCDEWILFPQQDKYPERQHKIVQLKNEIRLQLNLNDSKHKDIENLLSQLPSWTQSMNHDTYLEIEQKLVAAAQSLIGSELNKVKDESIYGDLRNNKLKQWLGKINSRLNSNETASQVVEFEHKQLSESSERQPSASKEK